MIQRGVFRSLAAFSVVVASATAQEASITIHADQVLHPVSRMLTGACLEDVNHEVYGGIDSQTIWGESFAEPPPQPPLKGFTNYGGRWTPNADGSLQVAAGDGPKLICNEPALGDGEVSIDLRFDRSGSGNAGLILKVGDAGEGADHFSGYEVTLEPSGTLVFGRHRQNWEPIDRVPCPMAIGQWVTLRVRTTGHSLQIFVNGRLLKDYVDTEHPLATGLIGLRTWRLDTRFRNLSITTADVTRKIPFTIAESNDLAGDVSGAWRAFRKGSAQAQFAFEQGAPFVGSQSQAMTFASGTGEVGIENQGLNRSGMNFAKGEKYEGYIYARAAIPTEVVLSLESRDGSSVYAEKTVKLNPPDWQRLDFTLEPKATDSTGRFAIKLKKPGEIKMGYAFLEPGPWGRFKGLPVHKDIAQGLIDQGVTVLRFGGCMANAAEYRWKNMVGPRAHRPPYAGWWHPHSSNGWGIFEFLNFCETAGFDAVPDVNADETPQDMADFIDYVNGSTDTAWGKKREQDGHPKPYHLKYLEIGNEERVNENYWQKFEPVAEAIWAKDPSIILIVGDFSYGQPIQDPFHFSGAAGHITSLAAQQKILALAKQHDREVWFDIHMWTDGPRPDFAGALSYIDALDKIADGAKHHVVIFEFNANNHSLRRALANAAAINRLERDGRLPIASSANCLQVDGQNDNDWDQGLLFLNNSKVWLQPPGYVTQMISKTYEPLVLSCETQSPGSALDVSAKRSEDGKVLVLQVVNVSDKPTSASIKLAGFTPKHPVANIETLAGPLDASNTASSPDLIKPSSGKWPYKPQDGSAAYTFPPNSFTVMKFD